MIEACITISITKKLFGWSKWGGANNSISTLLPADEWWCQCCASKQTKQMPGYMIPLDEFNRDFAKVCSACRNRAIRKRVKTFFELKTPTD